LAIENLSIVIVVAALRRCGFALRRVSGLARRGVKGMGSVVHKMREKKKIVLIVQKLS
jgi:hypothetical protein